MKKFIIFFVLMMLSWISFAQSNIVQEGSHIVIIEGDSTTVREYNTAIEMLLNAELNGKKGSVIMAPIRVDLDKDWEPSVSDTVIVYESKPSEIDTIIADLCWDVYGDKKQWNHAGDDQNVWPHPIYIPTKQYSMIRVMFYDTLTLPQKYFQTKWKFKRKKDYKNAITSYGTTGEVPFQFYIADSVVSVGRDQVRVRVFGSEDWYPQYIVDGVQREPSSASIPGSVEILGMPMRRNTCTITGLEPGKTYDIQVKGYCRRDESETDITSFTLTTLP